MIFKTTNGYSVKIDKKDLPLVSRFNWHYTKMEGKRGRTTYTHAYVKTGVRKKIVAIHRLILGAPAGRRVVHKNGDTLDNRRRNLSIPIKPRNGESYKRWAASHWLGGTSECSAWRDMRKRCYNRRDKNWKNYGGRGIKMDPMWKRHFLYFLSDVGFKPRPDLSIDRIDNNGDYEPGNCRWATAKEQLGNTRRSRKLTYKGRTMLFRDWDKLNGFSYGVTWYRIKRLGWSTHKAMTTPRLRDKKT